LKYVTRVGHVLRHEHVCWCARIVGLAARAQ
jgi:hypothetical protein